MSVAERRRQDVESTLSTLSLHPPNSRKQAPKPQTSSAPDTWEDEDLSSDTETPTSISQSPSAPPPTPISPTSTTARGGYASFESPYAGNSYPYSPGIYSPGRGGEGSLSPLRGNFRPEKTTAVAGRMIAGALGVRAPKKSEEARKYEKAVMEKEGRKRESEREGKRREEEEKMKAREAVWDA